MFALSSSLRIPDPYVHFKNPRPLSPPWGPQTYQPAQELTLSKAWQPTPVFLPGESHGQRSLTDCSPLGCREPDMTEATQHTGMHVQALPQGRTKSKAWETSLTFHWLGHCNSNAWGTGSVPGWEALIPQAPEHLSLYTAACRVCTLQRPCSTIRKIHTLQQEVHLLQQDKPSHHKEDFVQPK